MVLITCRSCKKSQPFMERMLYCSFCGTRYSDLETFNASQRIKQATLKLKYRVGYILGGLLILALTPPIMKNFAELPVAQLISSFLFLGLTLIIFANPFAHTHAQRLYPEKSTE